MLWFELFEALQVITAEDAMSLAGAGVTFRAGRRVELVHGFVVEAGATLTVVNDPTTNCL